MQNMSRKCWLALVFVLCLSPALFGVQDRPSLRRISPIRPKTQPLSMPEGGSALLYLLGGGVTCLGAMFVRSRTPQV
jgi:hypothetical protein